MNYVKIAIEFEVSWLAVEIHWDPRRDANAVRPVTQSGTPPEFPARRSQHFQPPKQSFHCLRSQCKNLIRKKEPGLRFFSRAQAPLPRGRGESVGRKVDSMFSCYENRREQLPITERIERIEFRSL